MGWWFTWDAWIAPPSGGTSPIPNWGDLIPGLPGMIFGAQRSVEKISRVPETTIEFGTAVLASDSDGYCRSANTGSPHLAVGLQFLGVAMRDMTAAGGIVNPWERHYVGYRDDSWSVAIVCVGRVWVIPTSAVHEGDPVVIGPDGTFMTSNNSDYYVPRAQWITSAPAGMLAVIEVNSPQVQDVRLTRDKLW